MVRLAEELSFDGWLAVTVIRIAAGTAALGTADAAAVLVPTAIGLTAGRAIPRLLERGTAARTWPWTGTPV